MEEQEEWRDVVGYEGIYQVSSFGKIKRVCVCSNGKTIATDLILKTCSCNGYPTVVLSWQNKHVTKRVHRLVAIAFVPNPNNYKFVHHKNHDTGDSRAINLEWVTPRMNTAYKVVAERQARGESSPRTKLTPDIVLKMKQMYATGEYTGGRLAEMFGVSNSCVSMIMSGINWRHVGEPRVPKPRKPPKTKKYTKHITEEDVCTIRSLYATGEVTQKELGEAFSVTRSCIENIVHKRSWRDVKC